MEVSTQGHGVSADDSAPDLSARIALRKFISVHVVFAARARPGDKSARPNICLLVCEKVPFCAVSRTPL